MYFTRSDNAIDQDDIQFSKMTEDTEQLIRADCRILHRQPEEHPASRTRAPAFVSGHIDEFSSAGVPVAIQYGGGSSLRSGAVFVLTSGRDIEQYDIATGSYKTISPPSSTNGPVVGIDYMQLNDLLLMRGNGTTGALQHYYY